MMLAELIQLSKLIQPDQFTIVYDMQLPDGNEELDDENWISFGNILIQHEELTSAFLVIFLNDNFFSEFGVGSERFHSFAEIVAEVINSSAYNVSWIDNISISENARCLVFTAKAPFKAIFNYDVQRKAFFLCQQTNL